MLFSHDTEHSLACIVDLVNSAPSRTLGHTEEQLPDLGALRALRGPARRQRRRRARPGRPPGRAGAPAGIGAVFDATDDRSAAAAVNTLVSRAAVTPRLTDHDGFDWHVHYFTPGASLAEHLTIDCGMALAHVVASGERERLRRCEAPDCDAGPRRPLPQPLQALLRRPHLRQPAARRGLPRAPARHRRLTPPPSGVDVLGLLGAHTRWHSGVTGPGPTSSRSSQRVTACTSRVVETRKISSAVGEHLDRLVDLAAAVPLQQQGPGDPGQAAGRQGRRAQLTVDDVEDVRPGALAEVPGEVGEHRLGGAALLRVGERDTFSAYDVVFSPASAPRSLRGQGTVATARGRRGRLIGVARPRRASAGVPAAGAQRRRPAGVGDPQPAQRQVLARPAPPRRPGAPASSSTSGSPSPAADRPSRLEVPGQRERLAVDDLDRLEDPVADGQPVVADRDGRSLRIVEKSCRSPTRAWPDPRWTRRSDGREHARRTRICQSAGCPDKVLIARPAGQPDGCAGGRSSVGRAQPCQG